MPENVDPGPYEDSEPGTLNRELRTQDPMKTRISDLKERSQKPGTTIIKRGPRIQDPMRPLVLRF